MQASRDLTQPTSFYQGYIKGYISHQHGKLVVSKGNPFPPLREVVGAE